MNLPKIITDISELQQGDLVIINWHGNIGKYRIELNKYGSRFAINDCYYDEDGNEINKNMIECLRYYNLITETNTKTIELIKHATIS